MVTSGLTVGEVSLPISYAIPSEVLRPFVGQTRIDKMYGLIEECRYGIHNRSRTELDAVHIAVLNASSIVSTGIGLPSQAPSSSHVPRAGHIILVRRGQR